MLEKVPLVALAAVSCRITYIAQGGAMKVIDDTIGFRLRLENALVSYGAYIGELFFPVRLAPLYPFPEHGVPWKSMAVAAFVLMAITAAVVLLRAWRWLAVGWLWYIAGLLPVIGLVQVGVQAMADRYTYLPHIGLYIMLAVVRREAHGQPACPPLDLGRGVGTAGSAVDLLDVPADGDMERQRDPLDQRP